MLNGSLMVDLESLQRGGGNITKLDYPHKDEFTWISISKNAKWFTEGGFRESSKGRGSYYKVGLST